MKKTEFKINKSDRIFTKWNDVTDWLTNNHHKDVEIKTFEDGVHTYTQWYDNDKHRWQIKNEQAGVV